MSKRLLSIFLLSVLICATFASCGKETTNLQGYKLPGKIPMTKSSTVAENDKLKLDWDVESNCLLVTQKSTGTIFGTTPYDYYKSPEDNEYVNNNLCSSLQIEYVEPESNLLMTAYSFSLQNGNGNISSKKIENGIRLIYYFDSLNIAVPVDYTLTENGVSVKVLTDNILEGNNKIYSVSILPFFLSCKNDTDSYLLTPSGSGALIYPDTNRTARRYEEPVYGSDLAEQTMYKNTFDQKVKLPVYGISSNGKGILAIIENGADIASICATAGDTQCGYSSIYSKFKLRGSSEVYMKDAGSSNMKVMQYSEKAVKAGSVSVLYMFAEETKCNYNHLAKMYRDYLKNNNAIGEIRYDAPSVMLEFLGGTNIKKLVLGIPYNRLFVSTNFDGVKNITDDFIVNNPNTNAIVNLVGFGKSGIQNTALKNSLRPGNRFGGKTGFEKLQKWSREKDLELFFDVNTMVFDKSSGGYSVRDDVAYMANKTRMQVNSYSIVTGEESKSGEYILSRSSLKNFAKEIINASDKYEYNNISVSDISQYKYSDYHDTNYYCAFNMSYDVENLLSSLKKNNKNVLTCASNLYAVKMSDYIYNVPQSSSGYSMLDLDIPFYQMIFKGNKTLYSPAINLSNNPKTEYLKAISTGTGLSFSLCSKYDKVLEGNDNAVFSKSVYSGIKDDLNTYVSGSSDFLNSVSNAEIERYTTDGNLSVTTFTNGVSVYVNYSNAPISTEAGIVEAESFITKK